MPFKRGFMVLVLFFLGLAAAWAEGFSSTVLGVGTAMFPAIGVNLKVFTPEPVELTADDFAVTEDAVRVASFAFKMEAARQNVLLVLDRSSSIEPAMGQVKTSAIGFVQNSMNERTKMGILSFASDLDITRDFSTDKADLVKGIQSLRPWGGTLLYDALYKATELLQTASSRSDSNTIVCLTDGKDESPSGQPNFSTKRPPEVLELARKYRVRIITVGLGNGIDEGALKGIAGGSGGWYLHAPTADRLAAVFQEINRKMMAEKYYRFLYSTPKPQRDGSRREVVITSRFKGVQDQGKAWYVAPKDEEKKVEAPAPPPECPPFSVIEVAAGRVNIFLSKKPQHRFERLGSDNQLEVKVQSDTLSVVRTGDGDLAVESPLIRKIIVRGGTCTIQSTLPFEELSLELDGIANLRLVGSATHLFLSQKGITRFDLSGLDCAVVDGEGSGDGMLKASETLRLKAGSGNYYVVGTTREVEFSGSANGWFSPTDSLKLNIDGNNSVLCMGITRHADLTIDGNAEVLLTPVISVNAKLDGNGNCVVYSMPAQVEKETNGTGDVELATADHTKMIRAMEKGMDQLVKDIQAEIDGKGKEVEGASPRGTSLGDEQPEQRELPAATPSE